MNVDLETLLYTVEKHIATVTLNRVANRNALNFRMCRDLVAVMEAIQVNDDVHVVLLKAAGNVFCAGADLKERQGMSSEQTTARRVAGFAAFAAIERLPQPVIAVVQGPAIGSGCEIAAACDFIVACTTATFRYPEVGWATIGATQRLPRIVGSRMAKELLLTGRVLDAAEGRRLGLVNVLFAPSELDAQAQDIAGKIAAAAPLAVRLTKRCIDRGVETSREGAMGWELLAIEENLRHSDWQGAIAAFGKPAPEAGNAG